MSKHTAVFVRHAKAVPNGNGSDQSRSLSESGRQQAEALGEEMAGILADVDTVFMSPALRAKETWEQIAKGAGVDPADIEVKVDEVIYSGGPMQILEMVRLESEGRCSVVVGHEPTISEAARLAFTEGEGEELDRGMPTGSAVVVEASRNWVEWHSHCATMVAYEHVGHKQYK